jgi:broad specificity phosphatase PhoE
LTLIRHAPTAATRRGAFPLDESIDELGDQGARSLGRRWGRVDASWCGPERWALETARALGAEPTIDAELREWDYGAWRGRSIVELEAAEPAAVANWMQDPAATAGGGESLLDLLARVEHWLEASSEDGRRIVAVTHASVIRAAVVAALRAPPLSV